MRSTQVTFRMTVDDERPFLRTYLTDAWDRFDENKAVESAWFWRFGDTAKHGPIELIDGTVVDGGGVILVVNGDPDPSAAVDAERPRWEELREDGPLESYETKGFRPTFENARQKMIENFGEAGGDLASRLRPIAAEATVELLREFDEDRPAVGESAPENPHPIGDWVLIHYLLKQNGHDWYDEIDACQRAITNRIRSLASFHDTATARAALEETIEEFERFRAEFEEEIAPDGD